MKKNEKKAKINFDKEFVDNNNNDNTKNLGHIFKNLGVIFIYFFISFFGGLLIVFLFSKIPSYYIEKDSNYFVYQNVENNPTVSVGFVYEYSDYKSSDLVEISYLEYKIILSNNFDYYSTDNTELYAVLDEILLGVYTENLIIYQSSDFVSYYGDNYFNNNTTITITSGYVVNIVLANLAQILILLLCLIPIFILLRKPIVEDTLTLCKTKAKLFINWPIYTLLIYAITIALNLIISLITKIFGSAPLSANQSTINYLTSTPWGFVLMIISACLIAPILEELVFRKAIFSLFKKSIIPLIISSILFGLVHISDELLSLPGSWYSLLINGISYIGIGFGFGYVYMKNNKNIFLNILVHATYNLVALLLTLIIK